MHESSHPLLSLVTLYKIESAKVCGDINNNSIVQFADLIIGAYVNQNQVFACGNGGNAALVANLITDLVLHPFVSEDKSKPLDVPRLRAFNLCESVSTITAIMNDVGPDHIFSEQLIRRGNTDDLLIGISGSGTSSNIVKAMEVANHIGMKSIALTKASGSPVTRLAACSVVIPGTSEFPGQTGKNNNNFHFEDCVVKLSHIATGLLKRQVLLDLPQNAASS